MSVVYSYCISSCLTSSSKLYMHRPASCVTRVAGSPYAAVQDTHTPPHAPTRIRCRPPPHCSRGPMQQIKATQIITTCTNLSHTPLLPHATSSPTSLRLVALQLTTTAICRGTTAARNSHLKPQRRCSRAHPATCSPTTLRPASPHTPSHCCAQHG